MRVTLATGRTLTGANNTLSVIGDLGSTPVILYNGSLVIQPGPKTVIAHRQIPMGLSNTILAASVNSDADLFIYVVRTDEIGLANKLDEWETVYFSGRGSPPETEFNGMPVFPLPKSTIDVPVTAMLVLLKPGRDYSDLKNELLLLNGISITSSGNRYIEIRPAGSSKAAGMQDVIRGLGLQQRDVLAVGDNDNDVELLNWAGIGIAVQGASPAALAASNYLSHFGAELCDLKRIKRRNAY